MRKINTSIRLQHVTWRGKVLALLILFFSPIIVSANSGANPDAYENNNQIYGNTGSSFNNNGASTYPGAAGSAIGSNNNSSSTDNNADGCTYTINSGSVQGSVTITIKDNKLDYNFTSISAGKTINLNSSQTHLDINDFKDGKCPQVVITCQQGSATSVNQYCSINLKEWWDEREDPYDNVPKGDEWEELSSNLDPNDFNNRIGCKDIFAVNDEGSVGWLLKTILNYIRIIGPVLVVLLSAIDFIKAVVGFDEKAMKEAQSKLIIRLVAALLLFLVPTLVELLLSFINATYCGL